MDDVDPKAGHTANGWKDSVIEHRAQHSSSTRDAPSKLRRYGATQASPHEVVYTPEPSPNLEWGSPSPLESRSPPARGDTLPPEPASPSTIPKESRPYQTPYVENSCGSSAGKEAHSPTARSPRTMRHEHGDKRSEAASGTPAARADSYDGEDDAPPPQDSPGSCSPHGSVSSRAQSARSSGNESVKFRRSRGGRQPPYQRDVSPGTDDDVVSINGIHETEPHHPSKFGGSPPLFSEDISQSSPPPAFSRGAFSQEAGFKAQTWDWNRPNKSETKQGYPTSRGAFYRSSSGQPSEDPHGGYDASGSDWEDCWPEDESPRRQPSRSPRSAFASFFSDIPPVLGERGSQGTRSPGSGPGSPIMQAFPETVRNH